MQYFGAHHPDRIDRLILIGTTSRYINELQYMWNVSAATTRTSGVAPMKIWFSEACLARNPPGIRYPRTALERASGEGYALACEALMFDPALRIRRRICCRMPSSRSLLH